MGGQNDNIVPHKRSDNDDLLSKEIHGVFAFDNYWLVTISKKIKPNTS